MILLMVQVDWISEEFRLEYVCMMCVYVCTHAHMYVCMHVCNYMYVCMYGFMYV